MKRYLHRDFLDGMTRVFGITGAPTIRQRRRFRSRSMDEQLRAAKSEADRMTDSEIFVRELRAIVRRHRKHAIWLTVAWISLLIAGWGVWKSGDWQYWLYLLATLLVANVSGNEWEKTWKISRAVRKIESTASKDGQR
jgi:hypothetical protein